MWSHVVAWSHGRMVACGCMWLHVVACGRVVTWRHGASTARLVVLAWRVVVAWVVVAWVMVAWVVVVVAVGGRGGGARGGAEDGPDRRGREPRGAAHAGAAPPPQGLPLPRGRPGPPRHPRAALRALLPRGRGRRRTRPPSLRRGGPPPPPSPRRGGRRWRWRWRTIFFFFFSFAVRPQLVRDLRLLGPAAPRRPRRVQGRSAAGEAEGERPTPRPPGGSQE